MESILTSELKNTDIEYNKRNPDFITRDKVFLISFDEIHESERPKKYVASDYAIMCGASVDIMEKYFTPDGHIASFTGDEKERSFSKRIIRSSCGEKRVYQVEYGTEDAIALFGTAVNNLNISIYPSFKIDFGAFNVIAHPNKPKDKFSTVTLGVKFPYSYVGNELNEKLNKLREEYKNEILSGKKPACPLHRTGKTYTGFTREDGFTVLNNEYELDGERYVYTKINRFNDNVEFADGTKCPETGEYAWTKVEEIPFRIINWSNLPKDINPEGEGFAKNVFLESEKGLIAMPFYPDQEQYSELWQNSKVRAWLNGYDIYEELEKGNGNKNFKAAINFNYKENNFFKQSGLEALEKRMLTKEFQEEIARKQIADKIERENQIYEQVMKDWSEYVSSAAEKYGLDIEKYGLNQDGGME